MEYNAGFILRTKITRFGPGKGQKHPIDRARWRQKSGATPELVSPHHTLALGAGGFLGRGFIALSGGDAEASNAVLRFVSVQETNRRHAKTS
jgi:hypothetical protein